MYQEYVKNTPFYFPEVALEPTPLNTKVHHPEYIFEFVQDKMNEIITNGAV